MVYIFNPVPPPQCEDETDVVYLNAVDDCIKEMLLKKRFEEALEKEKENASPR